MNEQKKKVEKIKVDTKEFDIPETLFIRDIENKVFQSIILQCLSEIEGIRLVEGNFIDTIFGRSAEGVKGIYAQQDEKHQSVNVKVEVNILYGIGIPGKAEEIQQKVAEEIVRLTGLHVSSIHVIFKNVITEQEPTKNSGGNPSGPHEAVSPLTDEYADEF